MEREFWRWKGGPIYGKVVPEVEGSHESGQEALEVKRKPERWKGSPRNAKVDPIRRTGQF